MRPFKNISHKILQTLSKNNNIIYKKPPIAPPFASQITQKTRLSRLLQSALPPKPQNIILPLTQNKPNNVHIIWPNLRHFSSLSDDRAKHKLQLDIDKQGIYYAALTGDQKTLATLMTSIADDPQEAQILTRALRPAIIHHHPACVQLLIDTNKIDLNRPYLEGLTPLMLAVSDSYAWSDTNKKALEMYKDAQITAMLLKHTNNVDKQNDQGETAWTLAHKENRGVIALLSEYINKAKTQAEQAKNTPVSFPQNGC